ncbi:endonuclease III-like protein 1 isoform X1 [Sycon ciliatum]|uniref:endonuclease III-like protein 1 isoform X1 n=1 Tax=Sycon ciliatum TaxID=27933 RepID=UPI0031F6824C
MIANRAVAMASSAGMRRKAATLTKSSPYFSSSSVHASGEPPAKKPRPHTDSAKQASEKPVKKTKQQLQTASTAAISSSTAAATSSSSNGSASTTDTNKCTKAMWQPARFEEHYALIREMRKGRDAPVDSMGAECCQDESASPNVRRFQTLVSLLLSSMTKDETTAAAMKKLQEHGLTVPDILATTESDVGKLIYPVGFWKTKAANLKKVAVILHEEYTDDIPDSIEKLVMLPGIGPKMAHLCMLIAWDEVTGIGVDTHVHRISNRLRWVPKKTKTPEDTRKALEEWLPKEYWRTINLDLVGFGQTRCLPVRPRCDGCLLNETCPKFGVDKTASPVKKKK